WRSPSASRRSASRRSTFFAACPTCSARWRSWCGSSGCGAVERRMAGLASISIDLDGLAHYAALHGLAPEGVSAEARALVHQVAVPRFTELVEGAGGRGTLFVIGGEVDAEARSPLEDALRRGHELASHSHGHDYALSRAPVEAIDQDLARAEEVLSSLGASRPFGFRAPGDTLSA